jgi:hypothetical protein
VHLVSEAALVALDYYRQLEIPERPTSFVRLGGRALSLDHYYHYYHHHHVQKCFPCCAPISPLANRRMGCHHHVDHHYHCSVPPHCGHDQPPPHHLGDCLSLGQTQPLFSPGCWQLGAAEYAPWQDAIRAQWYVLDIGE